MPMSKQNLAVTSEQARLEWSELSTAQQSELESAMIRRSRASGDTLFHSGEKCEGVYFVLSGIVGIRKTDVNGNSFLLHLAGAGEPVGYQAALSGGDYRIEAEILSPAEIGFVPRARFFALLAKAPEFAIHLLKQTAKDLDEAERRSFELITKPARSRVAQLLWQLKGQYAIETHDGATVMELPFTRKDMASLAGITPETISRVIRVFNDEGVAQFVNRTVRIPDWTHLDDAIEFEMAA